MTRNDVLDVLRKVLDLDARPNPDDHLIKDLYADSLDYIRIAASLESSYEVDIPQKTLESWRYVRDLLDDLGLGYAGEEMQVYRPSPIADSTIDLVYVPRMVTALREPSFISRTFTSGEQDRAGDRPQTYAGIYAAKESLRKMIGTSIDNTVEIICDDDGRPYCPDYPDINLSVSHDGDYAIAIATRRIT